MQGTAAQQSPPSDGYTEKKETWQALSLLSQAHGRHLTLETGRRRGELRAELPTGSCVALVLSYINFIVNEHRIESPGQCVFF